MKKFILSLIMLFSIGPMFCQNPAKKVLYTCGPNEDFYNYEFCSNLNVKESKFACLIQDKQKDIISLIWNGQKILSDTYIYVWNIDLNNKDGNVYEFWNKDKEECFIFCEGKQYGPYQNIYYSERHNLYNIQKLSSKSLISLNWEPNLKLKYAKGSFLFARMGNWFRHDIDGSIYPIYFIENNFIEYSPIYTSKNGKYKAEFSYDNKLITFNGKSFIPEIQLSQDPTSLNCYVTDTGVCVVTCGYDGFMIKNDQINYFNYYQNENFFDPETESVSTDSPYKHGLKGQFDTYNKLVPPAWRPEMSIYSQNRKDLFIADLDFDYIMINDKKIKSEVPIEAFYDEADNSFGWITIEGKSLVLYSYKL